MCKGFCVHTTQLNTAKALLQIHIPDPLSAPVSAVWVKRFESI